MSANLRYCVVLIIAAVFYLRGNAQVSYIEGNATHYKGKEAVLYSFSDLITYTRIKEATDTVGNDGKFYLSTVVNKPQAFNVKIENQVGKIYMLDKYKYGIIFPLQDSLVSDSYQNPNTEHSIDLLIIGDSTELNARIIEFNTQFDKFWEKNYRYFVAKKLHTKLDSFELAMNKRYEAVNSAYLKTYIKYTFALINNNTGRHRNYIAAKYILGKPINYYNYEYMDFFNQFFKLYLQKETAGKYGNDILDNINESPNYPALNAALKKDSWLATSDTLRELVILKGLYELYYTPAFSKQNIITLIGDIRSTTKVKEHSIIADNMLRIFNNLQAGAEAPKFALNDASGKLHQLSEFKGKYIYLDFFSPKSVQSLQEMKKLEQIKSKYGDKVMFISICMEGEEKDFKEFVKKNPKYNWLVLFGAKEKDLLNSYIIKAPATYFLINKEGYLVQCPAQMPSEGIEYKFEQMFKTKRGR